MGGSSSHRRKKSSHRSDHRNNSTRSDPIPIPSTTRTLNFDKLAITAGRGFNLLCKAGWSPGQPLGLSSADTPVKTSAAISTSDSTSCPDSALDNSLCTPLPIVVRNHRAGVGVFNQPSFEHSQEKSSAPSPFLQSRPTNHQLRGRTSKHPHPRSHKFHGTKSRPPSSSRRKQAKNRTVDTKQSSPTAAHCVSPSLIQQLADLDVFDPLRPRCKFDSNHIVRDLKALRKHENSCPANPHRISRHNSYRVSTSPALSTPLGMTSFMSDSPLEVVSDLDALSYSSVESEGADSDMSDLSSDSDNDSSDCDVSLDGSSSSESDMSSDSMDF